MSRRPLIIFSLLAIIYLAACGFTLIKYHLFWSVTGRMLISLAVALLTTSAAFLAGHRKARYDLVDVAWGLNFIILAVTNFGLQKGRLWQWDVQALVTILVVVWASRLSWFIWRRWRRSDHEDPRYTQLRQKWAKHHPAWQAYIRIFVIQGILALIISIPVVHINLLADTDWQPLMAAGGVVWAVGFILETLADHQQAVYLRQANRPPLLTTGLRSIVRHPNYLGEMLIWWGFALIALGTPHGWVGVGGAATITFLLRYLSGVPLKEARLARHPGWAAYKAKTPMFLPRI